MSYAKRSHTVTLCKRIFKVRLKTKVSTQLFTVFENQTIKGTFTIF